MTVKTKNQEKVSNKEWSRLYQAAIEFKNLKCWEWIYDSDLFGVRDPKTGEIGYCSVLGALGQEFALSVYPGSEGLDVYWNLHKAVTQSYSDVQENPEALAIGLKCLMVSFEDRSDLHKTDYGCIRELGLKFRGKKQWPMFRSYRPSFLPWFLTATEVRILTVALEQSKEVARLAKDCPDLLDRSGNINKPYLVRELKNGIWENSSLHPEEYEKRKTVPEIDEMRLHRLGRSKIEHRGIWATDCVLLPIAVEEGEIPFFPFGFPIMDEEGVVLSMDLIEPGDLERDVPDRFMELVEKTGNCPLFLLVGSEQAYQLLEPIAIKLKIELQQEDHISSLDLFIDNLGMFL